ncbi:MarR family winged helix-turn-helix transcriptional regulator [Clostridium sp.]|uniref:MarR family winged helix-turn-helix transcriptional regulator n=1 Tax=Clostridium sp. TaxID=1506 RepID=UPI001A458576|nr:MarR family winged helix-turn-helix transcriptional regulator [Clostridium sp.]MBK5242107.1 winged helix-turn-helix transcriptional regulator [Clostridium sp.]
MIDVQFQEKLIEVLKSVNGKINVIMRDFYEPYGLTSVQASVLLELHKNGEQNITDLCNHLYMGKSNLSPLCKRMEKSGFIERVRNLKDERYVNIKMTEYGEKIMKEVTKTLSESIIPTLNEIEEYKKNRIVEGLNILNECLSLGSNKNI